LRGYRRGVVSRPRTYLLVAAAAAAAAGLVVATVAFTRTSTGGGGSAHTETTAASRPSGAPTLVFDLGVRTDPEANALRRGATLYARGRRRVAAAIFRRYRSVEAQVGAALAKWPDGTAATVERLGAARPRDAFVQLELGLVRYWRGERARAQQAWRAAVRADPDTASAVHADDLLHPSFVPGLPEFVPTFAYPQAIARLSAPRQLAALAAAARKGGVRAKLLYGIALQRLGKPLSAERQFAAAAGLAPDDPEALTAAAVGRCSKADPSAAFSRLGPLAKRFPHAQTVRFHLGLLLLYLRQIGDAREELRLARAEGASTVLGRTASQLLSRLPRE
jgi:tetratricopeptide (TPR) repeat protein